MAKKKVEPTENLVELEVITYKAGEEPKEVSEPPSKLAVEVAVNPLLVAAQEAVGDKAVVLDVVFLEVGETKFAVVKLQKQNHTTLNNTRSEFDKVSDQTAYFGVHPEVISAISTALSKLTQDQVLVAYE